MIHQPKLVRSARTHASPLKEYMVVMNADLALLHMVRETLARILNPNLNQTD